MIGKVEGRQGGLGRILVTNKGGLGGREEGRKEKGRGGGRRSRWREEDGYVSIIDSKKGREEREMLTSSHHKPQ